jgi:DNA mismatch repair protein MutS2
VDPTSRFDLDALEFRAVRELLVERLVTSLGRPLVERLAPAADVAAANLGLRAADALAAHARAGERPPVGGAVEVRSWLPAFFRGIHQPTPRDIADLKRLLRAHARSRAWLAGRTASEALAALAITMPVVDDIADELERVVDDRGEVLDTASTRLAAARAAIESGESAVRAALVRVLGDERIRRCLQTPDASWRHGRPVLQVKAEHRGSVVGVLHDRSASGATVFIEPQAVIEMANQLADARADEHREIQVVLTEVCRGIRRLEAEIEAAIAAMERLDLAMASARLIVEDGWRAVPVAKDGPLSLRDALHPILLRTAIAAGRRAELVPLDLTLGDPQRMLVVTGPNTGGKTVVLKTVGLLALMAQCGLPIPAGEHSSIPWFDGIFADIGDEQAIAQNLSTFSSHVVRIVRLLEGSSARSLVLLDELGSGTDPEEGGALGTAVLEELEARSAFAVVTTHIGRLKAFAHTHATATNGAMAFDGKSLAPVYRLLVGVPGSSHALEIAQRVGMPRKVIARARDLLGARDERLDQVIERVEVARREAEAGRRRVEQIEGQAKEAARALEQRRAEIEQQRAWLEEEADARLDEQIRALREQLELALKALVGVPRPFEAAVANLRASIGKLGENTSLRRRRMRFLSEIKKDDTIYLPRLRRRCIVRKIDRTKELLTVEVGKLRLEVPFDDVSWLVPLDVE